MSIASGISEKGNPHNGAEAAKATTASNSSTSSCPRTAGAATVAKMVGGYQSGEKGHPPNGSEAAEAATASNHPIQAPQVAKLVGASQCGEKGHPPNGSEAAKAAKASNSSNPSCPSAGAAPVAKMVGASGYDENGHPPNGPDAAKAAAASNSANLSCLREGLAAHTIECSQTAEAATVAKMVRGSEYGEKGHLPNGRDAAEAAAAITSANPGCLKQLMMSRYQVLQNYVEDDESIAAFEQAEEQEYEEAVDPIWAIRARDQEQHPEDYHYEDLSAEEAEVESQLRQGAEDRAEEVLAEDDPEQYEDRQSAEGDAEPASQADDEDDPRSECSSLDVQAGTPQMFDGDCEHASSFLDSWDRWSAQLSPCFTQYQRTTLFLSLFQDPVDQWAEERLENIEEWRAVENMDDMDEALVEDTIGRFLQEFMPRKESAAEYADANGSEEDPDDASSVDHEEDSSWEVSPSPSLCYPDNRASEDEPDEAEEYVEEPRGNAREQYGCQDRVTTRDEEYVEDDLVDEYSPDTDAEKRVPPVPRKKKTRAVKQKKPVKKVKIAAKDSALPAKSPPTTSWEKKFTAKFGKGRLEDLRNAGVPDYMIEADLHEDAPLTTQDTVKELQDLFVSRPDLRGDIMDEMQRPAATTASWNGPNTFDTAPVQVQEAAPADPTPSSWGSQEANAAQEAQAAENTGWFAYTSNPDAMDTTAGRGRARAEAKCHHCWQTGHTRRNCPNRDQPRNRERSWIEESNDDDEPRAVRLPQAEPRGRIPQAATRGRSPTVKPVHGSNVATYAPTTRYSPSRLELPTPPRRAATPLPSPLPITGFRSNTPFTAIQHPSPTSPMTDEEFADRLAEMEIRRARAVKTQDWKAVQDLDFKANLAMAKKPPTLEEIEEELQKTETRLARALINGTATDIRRLDCAANRMAEEVMKRDIDYSPTHAHHRQRPLTAWALFQKRG
ncbi:hypothetical protein EDB84DRAFT_1442944 [Lactarius hengduanensis]|nr:hypothetical protein EDB84DRAFT_1442944 [Lactarius hengduanensis]